jgi:hypothetical protein
MPALPALRSVSARLLVGVFVTVGGALAGHALLSLRATEERFTEFVHADAERCGALVRKATHDAMLLNRKQDVQKALAASTTTTATWSPPHRTATSAAGRTAAASPASSATARRPTPTASRRRWR